MNPIVLFFVITIGVGLVVGGGVSGIALLTILGNGVPLKECKNLNIVIPLIMFPLIGGMLGFAIGLMMLAG